MTITIGQRVALTRDACYGDYDRAQARGIVQDIVTYPGGFALALVQWDGGGASNVNVKNLCSTRSVAFIESQSR